MTLRKKTFIIIALVLLGFLGALSLTSSLIILSGFRRLEDQAMRRDVQRAMDAYAEEGNKIDAEVRDWGGWTSAEPAANGSLSTLSPAQWTDSAISGLHVNLIVLVNDSGHIVFKTGFNSRTGKRSTVPNSFLYHLTANSPLVRQPSLASKAVGIVMLPEGPLLVASRPVLNLGDGTGRGKLIMGRYLTPAAVQEWGRLTRLALAVYPYNEANLPSDFQAALSVLRGSSSLYLHCKDQKTIAGYVLLDDLYGRPSLLLRVSTPRPIYAQGLASVRRWLLGLLGIALVIGLSLHRFLRQFLVSDNQEKQVEERYHRVVEQAADAILLIDLETRTILEANPAALDLLSVSEEELVGETLYTAFSFEPRQVDRALSIIQRKREFNLGDFAYPRKDGSTVDIEVSAKLIEGEEREFLYVVGRDIADRKRTEAALRYSEERYALAAKGANDGLWDWNLKTNEVYYSPRWKTMVGCGEKEIEPNIGEWFNRLHLKDYEVVMEKINDHLYGKRPHFECEYRIRHQDGTYYWMLSRGMAVRDENGKPYRMAGSQTDITTHKLVEQQLRREAFYDSLTGLPNRALFVDRLEELIQYSKRNEGHQFAVLFLDLDRFKVINDGLGHLVGDQLLVLIAEKLQTCVRPCDTVARFGGDEFTVLLSEIKDISDVTRIAERIQMELKTPLLLNGIEVSTSASIGIALSSSGYDRPEDLLRDADTTMYRAKALGRARHEMFNASLHNNAISLLELESDLRKAVERGEFQIHYQPILSVETGRILGCEALTYWQHPERGLVSPGLFIPLAEETGLIEAMGEWVLRMACAQAKIWQAAFQPDLKIFVNVSTRQFQRQNFPYLIQEVLRETGIEPASLELEITESVAMKDIDYSYKVMSHLNAIGVHIAIDDFGTGYSSLSYLKHFPIHALKIDRSFVNDITPDWDNVAIPDMIIAMAHSLQLKVVAEGVETEAQWEYIRSQGCDEMQGFLFSRPLSVEAFTEVLRNGGRLAKEPKEEKPILRILKAG